MSEYACKLGIVEYLRMAEVDQIILEKCREVLPDDGTLSNEATLDDLSSDAAVLVTVTLLRLVDSSCELPTKLPQNTAARYRLCSQIAEAVKSRGFRGDFGYQSLLYVNATELRRVLMFLIERLPDARAGQAAGAPEGAGHRSLRRLVAAAVAHALQEPWLPPGVVEPPALCPHLRPLFVPDARHMSPELGRFANGPHLKAPLRQVPLDSAVCSALALVQQRRVQAAQPATAGAGAARAAGASMWRSLRGQVETAELASKAAGHSLVAAGGRAAAVRSSPAAAAAPVATAGDDAPAPPPAEDELETLSSQLRLHVDAVQQRAAEAQQLTQTVQQLRAKCDEGAAVLDARRQLMEQRDRLFSLLSDFDGNERRLATEVAAAAAQLRAATERWGGQRDALTAAVARLRAETEGQDAEFRRLQDAVALVRLDRRAALDDYRQKEQLLERVRAELQAQPKAQHNRSGFIRRIIEIVQNIKKQKDEIERVLNDTQDLQRSLNLLSGTLERTFKEADELVFADAKTSEAPRRAYKLLAAVYQGYEQVATSVDEIGSILKEVRDLEDQLQAEQNKNLQDSLLKISADLAQIKAENDRVAAENH